MKSTLNKSVLAVLYYNEKTPNKYSLEDQQDRQKAERAFAKTTIDPVLFKIAVEKYKKMVEQEINALLPL